MPCIGGGGGSNFVFFAALYCSRLGLLPCLQARGPAEAVQDGVNLTDIQMQAAPQQSDEEILTKILGNHYY